MSELRAAASRQNQPASTDVPAPASPPTSDTNAAAGRFTQRPAATVGPLDRLRWPLILTGLVVAAIGGLAWWRKARG